MANVRYCTAKEAADCVLIKLVPAEKAGKIVVAYGVRTDGDGLSGRR